MKPSILGGIGPGVLKSGSYTIRIKDPLSPESFLRLLERKLQVGTLGGIGLL